MRIFGAIAASPRTCREARRESNSVEGINISAEDAIAAVDGEDPAEADRPTWRAVIGYHSAMDYIPQHCGDASFIFSQDVILAIHFMISQHDLKANPGNYRRGWIGVRNSATGEVVHEGVDRDKLELLMSELIDYLNDREVETPILKAAMAHLTLTLLHPFSDGNGRTARCLQTAVLTKEGIAAPDFSSIEEYIGRNQQEYYDILASTGGGRWNPDRNCKPWVRFCITGHHRQAQTLLRRSREMSQIYEELVNETNKRGLHERTALALLEAAAPSRVRNASYRVSADVSNNLASRDLKALVDAGLLIPKGERRGRHYVASEIVMKVRDRNRLPRSRVDPFAEDEIKPKLIQESLF
jgi:Fic family protein